MRIVNPLESLKIVTKIILLMSICIKVSAQSPYVMFGDNSKMLEAKNESVPGIYRVGVQSLNGANLYADFDMNKGIATLYDAKGNVLRQDSICENMKAMFTTVDPHAESYYHLSPYSYCGGNPVNRVDPTGMDWYQNNQTSYYTWYDGDGAREGFTYIGGKGSVLGEFENIIDNILCGEGGLGLESLYNEGFTFDIAPTDKGGLIGSKERGWDFFDEFVNGTGPEFSVLLGNHPYTEAVKDESFVKQRQRIIKSRGKNGKYTNAGRQQFYPWEASFDNPMQFFGTYRYDGHSSKDGRYINNVVTGSKSVTSLFYHIPFLKNHRRSGNREFGTTYQFYIWRSMK